MWEVEGGDGSIADVNCTLKIVKRIHFMLCIYFFIMFLFIGKIANDLHVVKSNQQFSVFTLLGPAASFYTDNIPHFLKYIHWASSESWCLGFIVVVCSLSYLIFLPSLFAVFSFYRYQMFEWSSSLCLNLLFRWSPDLKHHLYADDLNLYFQLPLFP